MHDAYVQAKKLTYASRLLRRFLPLKKLFEHPYRLETLLERNLSGQQAKRLLHGLEMVEPTAIAWRHYLDTVHGAMARRLARLHPHPADSPFAQNLHLLARLLGLSAPERDVLEVALLCKHEQELTELCDLIEPVSYAMLVTLVAGMTGLHRSMVQRALAPEALLCASGLVRLYDDRHFGNFGNTHQFELAPKLLQVIHGPAHTDATLLQCFCQQSPPPTITLDDCPSLACAVADLTALLRSACRHARQGINILLYGPPGVGKTALARLIAAQLPATLYELAVTEEDGRPARPSSRSTALVLAQRLLQQHSRALLLMDDADDLLNAPWGFGQAESLSTGWLNRLLEDNPVPTLWIVNQSYRIEEAVKRRFTTSVPFLPADAALRARLWRAAARRHHLETCLSDAALEQLATRYDVSVGLIDKALETATLIHNGTRLDQRTLDRLLERARQLRDEAPARALSPTPASDACVQETYAPQLLNTSLPLAELVAGVQRFVARAPHEQPGSSLCLLFHGAPGTGKTVCAHYLAQVTQRPLLIRRASDLLSKWVGETEQQVAEAFHQAQHVQGILLMDECDSFLHDRTQAHHQWEVSLVNELLAQIDRFTGGMLIMTTNRCDLLDAASLRRVVKVAFAPLTLPQRVQALQQLCVALVPDFSVV